MDKLELKKQVIINNITQGNKPTEIMQKNLTKAGLVKNSRWDENELMKERVKDLKNLDAALNNIKSI